MEFNGTFNSDGKFGEVPLIGGGVIHIAISEYNMEMIFRLTVT